MKYAVLLGVMSAALVALAAGTADQVPLSGLLAWTALSVAWVALGYAGLGARVFSKRPNGRMAWPAKVLLWPYLSFTWTIWHLYRAVSREDAYNCIDDDLIIGRRLLPTEVPPGFDHYVDLTAEFEDPATIRSQGAYHCLPILDASVPSFEDLEHAAERARHGRTYVHCAQGHGRTGLFALALLVQRGKVTSAEQGLLLLKRLRPALSLNSAQTGFIERYIATVQAKASRPS